MEKVLVLVESRDGHEEREVPKDQAPEVVRRELERGRWVSVERKDGSVDMLTKSDLPKDDDPPSLWAERFERVKTIISTNKVKGG